MQTDLIVTGERVVALGRVGPATVRVREGVIVSVEPGALRGPGDSSARFVDAGACAVLPGLVDAHVHVNEPGRTEWEGFRTATRAAAAGGITAIVDMPLNSTPVTTTVGALATKRREAEGQCAIDVAFWGGVVPGNASELEPMIDAGIAGFKAFLVPSGIDDFPHVEERDLRLAMPILARRGVPLLVHAELPGPIDEASRHAAALDPRRYATFLASRPHASEDEAIALMIRLAGEFGGPVHIVHLSSADAIPSLEEARARGVRVTCETCPHYLTFTAEEIEDGRTEMKCCPPIRERANRERLWDGLARGVIDLVVSDHSPCTPALKLLEERDFLRAWGGISSLQFGFAAVWTEAERRGRSLADMARWMSARPAELAGLGDRKGSIAPGRDADFLFVRDDASFEVTPAGVHHRHALTPYAGRRLSGVVTRTFLRGEEVYAGEPARFAEGPRGRQLAPALSSAAGPPARASEGS